jgi:drug/metabolite transporter (DMT)-like permease
MEIGGAVAGLLFIIVGVAMVVWPTEMSMTPAGPGPGRYSAILGPDKSVHVSKTGSQIYGGLAILGGICFSYLSLYRGRK